MKKPNIEAVRNEIGMVIPEDRLPAGFAQSIENVPSQGADPKPAATAVLMRDGVDGLEIMLMKRHRSSGFVPGAYVFPGGRVDPADDSVALQRRVANPPSEPPLSYWLAAVREVFEETGVLLADGPGVTRFDMLTELREALMTDRATLIDVLDRLEATPLLASLAYAAHWITPVAEPRRYDTRFFYAAMPSGGIVQPDEREMSDAIWVTPAAALSGFQSGALPMVFPTVRTIEGLLDHGSVAAAFEDVRRRQIEPILPTLVRVNGGIGIVIDAAAPREAKE